MLNFKPISVLSVDIDHPLPHLDPQNDSELESYTRALVLVRLHTYPLGIIEVDIPQNGLDGTELAKQIWASLSVQIQNHLSQDEIIQTAPLDQAGFDLLPIPECLQKRESLLASAPFVSIVVATCNRVDSLQACLKSILALDYPNFEVIVVDNAPRFPETANFIRTSFPHSSKVRYMSENIPGLGVAHNRGLTEVRAPIVAFTDDDVIVDLAWLKSIVENFQRDPQIGCVTGMIMPYEIETPAQLLIEQFGGFSKGYRQITFDMKENRPQDFLFPYSAGRFGSGANMAFRTSILRSIGGFDAALGAGTIAKSGDDLAAFFDVISMGYRLVYEPGAILYHKHRRDYPGLVQQAYGYGVGMSAFLMKTILDKPLRLIDILLKTPAGLRYLLDPHSRKNQKKQADYPPELTRLELKGYLLGPLAYLRSRWRVNKLKGKLPKINIISELENRSLA